MTKDNFQSLSVNKNELILKLAYDKDLAKCLLCSNSNFKDYPLQDEEMDNLCWNYIFPYHSTGNTQTEAKSYITMQFGYRRIKNANVWKVGTITFYLFCHKKLVHTDYGILRYDYMLQRVSKLLNDAYGEGWVGKMECDSMNDIVMDSEGTYVGVCVKFINTEFM